MDGATEIFVKLHALQDELQELQDASQQLVYLNFCPLFLGELYLFRCDHLLSVFSFLHIKRIDNVICNSRVLL